MQDDLNADLTNTLAAAVIDDTTAAAAHNVNTISNLQAVLKDAGKLGPHVA